MAWVVGGRVFWGVQAHTVGRIAGGATFMAEHDKPNEFGTEPAGAGEGMSSLLLEVSSEVANQVGGIYQVIRSKVPLMQQRWGERYLLVGPYDHQKAGLEFEPSGATGWLAKALDTLAAEGLKVHYGRWLVPGRPRVLLVDHGVPPDRLGAIKADLWRNHGIEVPVGDAMIDGVCSFADGVRRLIEAISSARKGLSAARTGDTAGSGVIVHFHEWLGGLAIPMLRHRKVPVATVFTTHATLLGRYIASSREDFYDQLRFLDNQAEAARFNVKAQHQIERACAHGAHVFTTVSSITAEECEALLGRPIDVVTPNGLTIGMYNTGHEQQRLHGEYKEAIHRFVMGHFFPSYSFDLDRTMYFFTSGRFEPRNKGFDLCLEAMARLNYEMKASRSGKTVVFFIISKRPTRGINPLAMEKRGVLNELREICTHVLEGMEQRLFHRAAAQGKLQLDDLVDEYWMLRYRRSQHALKQNCLPMVVTHNLEDDQNDPVLNHIRVLGLLNRQEDPVKVVYHPDFINPHNRLWGMEYDQFVRGCHMGLFPSTYEPWGYTPLECLAMGIPALTSDLAGFGRYVQETFPDHDKWGMQVMKRRGRWFHDAAADLTRRLVEFTRLERRDRIAMRNEVDRHSWDFDWSRLGRAYHTAHDLAQARLSAEISPVIGGVPMVSAATLSRRQSSERTSRVEGGAQG
jgi:glycogen synthase